jgi:hypothetical protein
MTDGISRFWPCHLNARGLCTPAVVKVSADSDHVRAKNPREAFKRKTIWVAKTTVRKAFKKPNFRRNLNVLLWPEHEAGCCLSDRAEFS